MYVYKYSSKQTDKTKATARCATCPLDLYVGQTMK